MEFTHHLELLSVYGITEQENVGEAGTALGSVEDGRHFFCSLRINGYSQHHK